MRCVKSVRRCCAAARFMSVVACNRRPATRVHDGCMRWSTGRGAAVANMRRNNGLDEWRRRGVETHFWPHCSAFLTGRGSRLGRFRLFFSLDLVSCGERILLRQQRSLVAARSRVHARFDRAHSQPTGRTSGGMLLALVCSNPRVDRMVTD